MMRTLAPLQVAAHFIDRMVPAGRGSAADVVPAGQIIALSVPAARRIRTSAPGCPTAPPAIRGIGDQLLDKGRHEPVIDALGSSQERPVRSPQAPVGGERLEQRFNVWPGIVPGISRRRAFPRLSEL